MTVLLSVQFRNLLPSEELLESARTLWSELALPRSFAVSRPDASGDAHLSITQRSEVPTRYEVQLSVPGADSSATACGEDAQQAIESVFRQVAQRDPRGSELAQSVARAARKARALAKVSR